MEATRKTTTYLCGPTALLLLLALLPAALEAKVRRPQILPLPAPPAAAFESYGSALGVTAENGFSVSVVNGEWRHRGHKHVGATGSITSPWGEEMSLRFWFNQDGSLGVEYDGSATIHYTFNEIGGLKDVAVVTRGAVKRTRAGDRALRAAAGTLDVYSLDYAPYEALFAALATRHSPEFLGGVERLNRRLGETRSFGPAGCFGDILQCTGAILLWAASVPTIAASCTAGAAFTLGAACLGAILAHEGAGIVAAGACVNAIQNCMNRDRHRGDPGGGCNGPGGGPE